MPASEGKKKRKAEGVVKMRKCEKIKEANFRLKMQLFFLRRAGNFLY